MSLQSDLLVVPLLMDGFKSGGHGLGGLVPSSSSRHRVCGVTRLGGRHATAATLTAQQAIHGLPLATLGIDGGASCGWYSHRFHAPSTMFGYAAAPTLPL